MTTVTLPAATAEKLDALAEESGRSRDDIVAEAIEQLFEQLGGGEEPDVPEWHIPLVHHAIEQADRGELIRTSAEEINAKLDARRRQS